MAGVLDIEEVHGIEKILMGVLQAINQLAGSQISFYAVSSFAENTRSPMARRNYSSSILLLQTHLGCNGTSAEFSLYTKPRFELNWRIADLPMQSHPKLFGLSSKTPAAWSIM